MPVSAANSQVVFDALKASGVRLMSALPETWLVHLIRLADDDPDVTLVRLAKEEEGVGISMGAHLAGVQVGDADAEPRLPRLDQRHRLGRAAVSHAAADADQRSRRIRRARSLANRRRRGHRAVLAALRIPIMRLDDPARVPHQIRQAQTLAYSSNKPVALLLTRDLMWEES